ncbi:zinc finger HIT domain-containing protein 2 [Anopheles marshallii]|uniref:zinc finger HIT domain-containing protein 2 n=1 Tax=Anopheles marshallii TaxID=1521116 RepID=UPI00237A4E83|nr:zinc finger HIT domain-containing protein 2 [Anopheles marshallii]
MNEQVCKICGTKEAKYNCPRCNMMYCSVQCYKAQQHVECSEGFYRENVVQELALRKADAKAAQSSKTMLEILQRVEQMDSMQDEESSSTEAASDVEDADQQLDSDDEAQEVELANRLKGINLDNAAEVWDRLTDGEKEEFQRFLENGDIAKMLPDPNIWWAKEYRVDLVQAAEEPSEQEQKMFEDCPKISTNIAKLSDILQDAPSPTVRHNIANVLAAYSFVYRYFLGDIHEDALETVDCMLGICVNLKKSGIFDSELMAVTSVVSECCNEQLPTDNETLGVLKTDVQTLFMGPKGCGEKYRRLFLLSALSDIRTLLSNAKRALKNADKKVEESHKLKTNQIKTDGTDLKHVNAPLLRSCVKKMEFYLAYARSSYF